MADIKVEIRGDASGAVQAILDANEAMKQMAEENAKAAEKMKFFVETLKKSAEAVYDFAKESLEAFESQEKADRSLQRVAGELTETFKAQASAMQEQLGVSDDMVEGIQTMLLRFGEAPANVEATTRAIVDYAAKTGVDATQATHALLAGVQSGKTVFKELGLEYEKTGVASKDLANVTKALAGQFGGSALEEANTVAGSAHKAKEAIGEFKESVGGLINDFIAKTGAVNTFTQAIKDLQLLLFGANENSLVGLQHNLDKATEKLRLMREANASWTSPFKASDEAVAAAVAEVERLQAAWDALQKSQRAAALNPEALPTHGSDRATGNKHGGEESEEKKAHDKRVKEHEKWQQEDRENDKRYELMTEEDEQKANDAHLKMLVDADAEILKQQDKANKEAQDAFVKDIEESGKEVHKILEKQQKDAEKATRDFERMMGDAGKKIAMAFISEMSNVLTTAMAGGEIDPLEEFGNVAAMVLEVAGFAIGAYFGVPEIGGALGGLAGTAVKEATKTKPKKHDGGWTEPEHYHSGGWPGLSTDEEMAVLQGGERVLSRSEVQRMGGRAGVDAAASRGRGGPGMNIHVSTLDARSFTEFMGDSGGRGFYNTLRTGQGMLSPIFGR